MGLNNIKIVLALFVLSSASACITVPVQTIENYPTGIVEEPREMIVDGSIYNSQNNRFLFEDVRAKRVGDVINVVLEERTDATKAASTSTNKASGVNIPTPTILGGGIKPFGRDILQTDIAASSDFSGQADSSQSNRLSGSVAVTITHKMANGNLWIQGQKTLTLNQGSEIVKVSGQIRPTDIAPDNSVRSSKIADAQITYGGTGLLANANNAGWLTRVMQSPIWPF